MAAPTWLDSGTYPDIRDAIEAGLDSAALPDSVIGRAIYVQVAELAVKGLDPDWATRDSDGQDLLTLAAILWCASLLIPAIPNVTRESIGQRDYEYQTANMTPAERVASLRARASEIVGYATGDTTGARPAFFAVAHGYRVSHPADRTLIPDGSTILGG